MQIGTFKRHVSKTLTIKGTKTALRTVSKNTARTHIAQATVALKGHTGRLLQVTSQYLLGMQSTQEMKDESFVTMGDIGYDLTSLARVLKVKLPSSTKKIKLVGTRSAALLQLDSLTTNLLIQVEQGAFTAPKMTTVQKMVSMPQKGGAKEERSVEVVDSEADAAAEAERQTEMRSYLSGAIDVFWRLNFDIFSKAPAAALEAKFARMQQEFPNVAFDTTEKPKKVKAAVPA